MSDQNARGLIKVIMKSDLVIQKIAIMTAGWTREVLRSIDDSTRLACTAK
jgi:hypothetical protein